jgi:hydrogenase maturation protein HypF
MKERAKIMVRGTVQGVGFRPFVYRLATEMALNGWVSNSSQGVQIEIEGERSKLDEFRLRLEKEKPPQAAIHSIECTLLDATGSKDFKIRVSDELGAKTACIPPDLAMCADCLREMLDPSNRRYLYPFTNCTNCGPRFSIINSLPYDRANTSMNRFAMCPECKAEYTNPRDRRFHAQPNACPKCGPRIALWDEAGNTVGKMEEALEQTVEALRAGRIVALKGLGGFQLMVDAENEDAVRRLRECKRREEKPFALMYPSLTAIKLDCKVSEAEAQLLLSSAAPIVLLERLQKNQSAIAASVAPRNPMLGAMLPYTPLHHLLMHALGSPVVATSGNRSNEPICIDEHEAVERLHGIADFFLVHNRPIVRHVDDSIARVMLGREQVLRRARGYAPMPIRLSPSTISHPPATIFAVGAQLKSAVALSVGSDVFLSQHIGDLETQEACEAFDKVSADLQRLYAARPKCVARDMHPDYYSFKYAEQMAATEISVQHHYAHVLSCMAENELDAPALGVAWDGTGLGTDGTIWGGEFLLVDESGFERVAHLRRFRLPGGDTAVREPRRSALGLLHEIFGGDLLADMLPLQSFSASELTLLGQMLDRKINVPVTTSAGRLFDAVASMVGLQHRANFEGQAAMELEFVVQAGVDKSYPFELQKNGALVVDWEPMVFKILEDVRRGERAAVISAKFHNTLAEMIVGVAHEVGMSRVALSGGCFQNKYLTERTVRRLRGEGFKPYWHQRVPTNDGGIALGQVIAAVRARKCVAITETSKAPCSLETEKA